MKKEEKKKIKEDVNIIVDNCETLCYISGDDFGTSPIKKINKKMLKAKIVEYICGR